LRCKLDSVFCMGLHMLPDGTSGPLLRDSLRQAAAVNVPNSRPGHAGVKEMWGWVESPALSSVKDL
jgi:hypothetical protein